MSGDTSIREATQSQEKLNQLVTDVAVIKEQMKHQNERHEVLVENDKTILARLESLSMVKESEFESYKTDADEKYVSRSEVAGLLKTWDIATSWITKTIVVTGIVIILVVAVNGGDIKEVIPKLGGQ